MFKHVSRHILMIQNSTLGIMKPATKLDELTPPSLSPSFLELHNDPDVNHELISL